MSNTQSGSILNEFAFAARVASVFSGFQRVAVQFSLLDELNPVVKFDPRFFLMQHQGSAEPLLPLKFSRAWSTPLGVFLFVAKPNLLKWHTLFVPASSPQIAMLRAVLNRLQAQQSIEKTSLSTYFWRMHVLR